jgi:glucosyl-dolichyl phosphate glucuronosyltransferase
MISIIVCTYNRAEKLTTLLRSLSSQQDLNSSVAWEIVVVDNNSSDGTKTVVEEMKKNTRLNLRYLYEKRQGKSFAMNTGVAHADGDILVFTDDDAIADRRWLASIYEATQNHRYRAFGGKILPLWEHPLPPWIDLKSPYSRHFIGGAIALHDRGDEAREYDETMWVPVGGNMFFRKQVFDQYGRFRTDMGPQGGTYRVGEDGELSFRLKKAGEPILYWPKAIVYHPVSPQKLSKKYLLDYSWEASQTAARMANLPLTLDRRAKEVLKTVPATLENVAHYALDLVRNESQARLYHQCQLVELASRAYYYLTAKENLSVPAE